MHYPKPELERVLGKTLGVPLFQEQAMQVAIQCAGFTPGEADQLRRSMATLKFTGGVSHFRDKFIEGMVDKEPLAHQPNWFSTCPLAFDTRTDGAPRLASSRRWRARDRIKQVMAAHCASQRL